MIYAINKRTKEHRRYSDSAMSPSEYAHEWEVIEADADGWIPWDGGECPLPGSQACQWRSDEGDYTSGEVQAGEVAWHGFFKIAAYRPILDAEPETPPLGQRPEWLDSKPEAVEWEGQGLPPVGTECNCWHTGSHQGAVTVRYIGSEMCVLLNHDRGEEQCGPMDAYRFEPLRTTAQQAVEAMVNAAGWQCSREDCEDIYHAIRDGKVPGVKLEGDK